MTLIFVGASFGFFISSALCFLTTGEMCAVSRAAQKLKIIIYNIVFE